QAPSPQATAHEPQTSRKTPHPRNPARQPGHCHARTPGQTASRSSTRLWITADAPLVDSGQSRPTVTTTTPWAGSGRVATEAGAAQRVSELEEVTPMLSIVGGMDIHRKQVTFDYLDLVTGEVKCGQIAPADRAGLRAWLERFGGVAGVAFAVEACTGWRYVAEELQRAGIEVHLAGPADTAAARGRKMRAKTDKADSRLMRDLLA